MDVKGWVNDMLIPSIASGMAGGCLLGSFCAWRLAHANAILETVFVGALIGAVVGFIMSWVGAAIIGILQYVLVWLKTR